MSCSVGCVIVGWGGSCRGGCIKQDGVCHSRWDGLCWVGVGCVMKG